MIVSARHGAALADNALEMAMGDEVTRVFNSQWLFTGIATVTLLVAAEVGNRLGLHVTREIQSMLWEQAHAAVIEAPTPVTALFVSSLNDLIDTDAERIEASLNRVPPGVWLIIVVVAAAGTATSSYSSGAYGVRSALSGVLLPLLISIVLLLIFDLTRGREGTIGVSQQPLIDLQRSLRSR